MNVCETCVCIFIMYFVMNQRGLQPALRVLVRYAGVYECEVRESFPTFQPPVISGLPGIFGIVLHGQLKTWSKRWRMTGTLGHLWAFIGCALSLSCKARQVLKEGGQQRLCYQIWMSRSMVPKKCINDSCFGNWTSEMQSYANPLGSHHSLWIFCDI